MVKVLQILSKLLGSWQDSDVVSLFGRLVVVKQVQLLLSGESLACSL